MKRRLDSLLLDHNLAASLEKARALILAGQVLVADHKADKPGLMVDETLPITLKESSCPYVSRGGVKLAHGLDYFAVRPQGLICADIGASTGGFTDCLLQNGAVKVYAVDVGYGQLAWSLRQDSRVIVMERTNARHLTQEMFPAPFNLAVIDAAFISLKLLLPPLIPLFAEGKIAILALIKPQFEVGRGENASGVITDPLVHEQVISEVCSFSQGLGLTAHGVTASPLLGPKGNTEFLTFLTG
ncbi:MAG: TlyA family RNA methyltransferase [Desulfobulbaceae bacterium]|nr:TlyA family RNA methyltransferase [Desulfobulbaceae bacterium]